MLYSTPSITLDYNEGGHVEDTILGSIRCILGEGEATYSCFAEEKRRERV